MKRCSWAGDDPQMIDYHDREWGVPLHDDRALFELLILEGAQAGLSWSTILRKRENYRAAFDGFDAARSHATTSGASPADGRRGHRAQPAEDRRGDPERARLPGDPAESGSFDAYIWSFVDGRPIRNRRRGKGDVPATTKESDAMSKDLQRRGFRFVGSTICYAFMQSAGLVNDHLVSCFRY